MTKILIYSDLHLELNKKCFSLPEDLDGDIMILAGDILAFDNPEPLREFLCTWNKPVLYIAGNHEYYTRTGDHMMSLKTDFKVFSEWHFQGQVKFLDSLSFEYENISFFGGTMWTDQHNGTKIFDNLHRIRDYRDINIAPGKQLRPTDVMQMHEEYLEHLNRWLEKCNNKFPDHKRVVITHHGPNRENGEVRCDAAFVSTKTKAIIENLDNKIDLWYYGHTHKQCDYMLGNTRIISNAYGYSKIPEEQENFDPYGVMVEL